MLQKHGLLEQSWLNKSWWGVSTSGVDPRSFDNLGVVCTVSAWALPLPCSPAEKGGTPCGPSKSVPATEPWMGINHYSPAYELRGAAPHSKVLCTIGRGPAIGGSGEPRGFLEDKLEEAGLHF